MRRVVDSGKPAREQQDRMLPLINIVFLLLIFFMIAGRLSTKAPFDVEPPNSQSEAQLEEQQVTIYVGAEGEIAMNGDVVDRETLLTRLTSAPPDGVIRVMADNRVDTPRVVDVLQLLQRAQIPKVQLLTLRAGDRR